MRYLWANSLLFGCRRSKLFYSWSWYYTTLLKAVVVLMSTVATGAILQQSALLQAPPSLYSAVGGGHALLGRYTTHLGAVGIAVTC